MAPSTCEQGTFRVVLSVEPLLSLTLDMHVLVQPLVVPVLEHSRAWRSSAVFLHLSWLAIASAPTTLQMRTEASAAITIPAVVDRGPTKKKQS